MIEPRFHTHCVAVAIADDDILEHTELFGVSLHLPSGSNERVELIGEGEVTEVAVHDNDGMGKEFTLTPSRCLFSPYYYFRLSSGSLHIQPLSIPKTFVVFCLTLCSYLVLSLCIYVTFPAHSAISLSFSPSSVTITEGTSSELSPSLCIVKVGEAGIDIPVVITTVDGTAESK